MTTSRQFAALVLFLVAALSMAWLQAAPAPQAGEEGFTPLFNGKDFTGWIYGHPSERHREQERPRLPD